MIQNQTKIAVRDNSGVLRVRCINAGSGRYARVGNQIKTAVLKSKIVAKQKSSKRNVLQDLLLVQTKKKIIRYDGSTVSFNENKGVCVSIGNRSKIQLGFKRINTAVAIELKKSNNRGVPLNLLKLAKSIM